MSTGPPRKDRQLRCRITFLELAGKGLVKPRRVGFARRQASRIALHVTGGTPTGRRLTAGVRPDRRLANTSLCVVGRANRNAPSGRNVRRPCGSVLASRITILRRLPVCFRSSSFGSPLWQGGPSGPSVVRARRRSLRSVCGASPVWSRAPVSGPGLQSRAATSRPESSRGGGAAAGHCRLPVPRLPSFGIWC